MKFVIVVVPMVMLVPIVSEELGVRDAFCKRWRHMYQSSLLSRPLAFRFCPMARLTYRCSTRSDHKRLTVTNLRKDNQKKLSLRNFHKTDGKSLMTFMTASRPPRPPDN
eukprot:4465534-Amphidinium_carterae.1